MNASETTLTTDRSTPAAGHLGGGGRLTPQERAEAGRAARELASRGAHGEWQPSPDRADPVDLLEEQATSRVPELVPLRYGRMLVSPFTFFRGAAYLMAADLAGVPRTGLNVQLCGDAHLSNFGTYAAPDRRLVFSLTDFDETLPGPFEWDVKRLAASFAVAGRDRGFNDAQREAANLAVGASYRDSHAHLGRHAEARHLVRAAGRRRAGGCAEAPAEVGPAQAVPQERRQGSGQGQHEGLRQAGRGGRRTPAAHQRPARARQARGAAARPGSTTRSRRPCTPSCVPTDAPCRATIGT